jgi:hypothetical protein
VGESMGEWVSKWFHEWMNGCLGLIRELICEWLGWIRGRISWRMSAILFEWMEWIYEWMSELICE